MPEEVTKTTGSGIVALRSAHSVDDTLTKLKDFLLARGIKIFAIIDHSVEAEQAGLSMPNTKLAIFGAPKAGTPIMLASPSAALDLPLKALVAEDLAGTVWLSYNSTNYLQARHGIPEELMKSIAGVETVAAVASE